MSEAYHKPGLYKWKRQTNPRVVPSTQRIRSNNDIQNWLQKVEEASNLAADLTFADDVRTTSGRHRGKLTALRTKEQLQFQDEACTEAEELLTQWMNEKVVLNDEVDEEYIGDVWHQRAVEADVKREWDNLVEDEDEGDYHVSYTRPKSPDPYQFLYEAEESEAVASVLNNMMKKDVVKETFKKDLGFEEKRPDPRLKMELRHKQVKENREKREREIENSRRERQAKRDAHLQAKKILQQEEKDREIKSKREEMEIQKEMVKIRKQLQDERHLVEEDKLRKREERMKRERESREERERQMEEEERRRLQNQRVMEERKKTVMHKMAVIQTKQSSKNLRVLHQHFTAWYELILQKRLLLGKCGAMSDWKLLLRSWNAWKSYSRSRRLDQETRQHERNLLDNHRKNQMAERHYKTVLLQKHFTAWLLWLQHEEDRKQLERAQEVTRQKMMSLLEKAASGKLWQDHENNTNNEKITSSRSGSQSARNHSHGQNEIDDFFAQNDKILPSKEPLSSQSDTSLNKTKTQPSRVPTQAWQVNRRHLNLTNEEIAGLGGGGVSGCRGDHSDRSVRRRFGTQPWMNTHFVVNNFEHRYSAQQKILTEQQHQLKEQRRLIEELQYKQNNQLLVNQLGHGQGKVQGQHEGHDKVQSHHRGQCRDKVLGHHEGHGKVQGPCEVEAQGGVNGEFPLSVSNTDPVVNGNNLDSARTTSTIKLNTPRSASTSRSNKTETMTNVSSVSKTSNNTKHSQILKSMEERAAERARMKREREEKRRQLEEERLARLAAEEEERLKAEEEEKKARIDAHRAKKKLEKQREEEKQREMEKMKELNKKADEHYTRSIIKYRGFVPMVKLVRIAKENQQRAVVHYNNNILQTVVTAWHGHTKQAMEEKYEMADKMRTFLLIQHCFRNWRRYKHHMGILEKRADRFYERNTLSKIVTVWVDYATDEKMAYWQKERQAKEHYLWYLQKKTLLAWRRLPMELQLEREKEKRRAEMRQKVASMLPDFEGIVRKSAGVL